MPVAVKLEFPRTSQRSHFQKELKAYELMKGSDAVPELVWAGEDDSFEVLESDFEERYRVGKIENNFLVTALKGKPLESITHRERTVDEIRRVAIGMLDSLEKIHKRGVVHRDIKPANFVFGKENPDKVYAIDFGICSLPPAHWNATTPTDEVAPCGNAEFASLNCHEGNAQTARDDLEAVGYVLLYLLKGREGLPWWGTKGTSSKNRWENIFKIKKKTSLWTLCRGLPIEFWTYLSCCRKLNAKEKPDYKFLRSLFEDSIECTIPTRRKPRPALSDQAPRRTLSRSKSHTSPVSRSESIFSEGETRIVRELEELLSSTSTETRMKGGFRLFTNAA